MKPFYYPTYKCRFCEREFSDGSPYCNLEDAKKNLAGRRSDSERKYGEVTMKGIDKKYIDVLQQFGFHLYTTETGYKLCYNPIGGTFSANFNDENFVENLINFAETFDPSTYASVEIEGPCSIKELAETVKSMEKIQILLLKVALAFIKINKESMVK